MHGTRFYNFKHQCAGVVTPDKPTKNGYYTCWHPAKQFYKRLSAKQIEDWKYQGMENSEYCSIIEEQLSNGKAETHGEILSKLVLGMQAVAPGWHATWHVQEQKDGWLYFSVFQGGKK